MKDIATKLALNNNAPSGTPTVKPVGDSNIANGDTLSNNIQGIINAVIGVLGIIAVVIIIVGGVGYMTSSGDSSRVKKAKDTILYGVIGLVICVLAFAIVNFVIFNILGAQPTSSAPGFMQGAGE